MHSVAIIQARLGSTRLAGKVLHDLNGRPVLAHVVERTKRVPGIDGVVVATTTAAHDGAISALAHELGVGSYRGSEADVLDRYYQAALAFRADVVMRITADCPLLDPEISGRVVARFARGDVEYVNNSTPPTFPDGLDTEVFAFAALERAWREARLPSEREHVTSYIWNHPDRFRLATVVNDVDLSHHRWTVDSPEDLAFVRAVHARLPPDSTAMADVLAVFEREPELLGINAGQIRNEGYLKSLKQDQGVPEK